MWRPEGWEQGRGITPTSRTLLYCIEEKPLKYRHPTEGEKGLFELGADAMLEALRREGKHTDGRAPTLSINIRPEQSGWLVFIPDKEDTNVGH
uniref:Uncharacterized protein n=1 Tax=viral metagenome TaxID=1070528 RepID=A0A6M3KAZ8_9ZZZZ